MTDMLVKLYELPEFDIRLSRLEEAGIIIRRPMAYERHQVIRWVADHFNDLWASECAVAFGHAPADCHIAVRSDRIVGFCCVNCTFRNFLGPVGVAADSRGAGVGGSLVWAALNGLRHEGFAYAVIGDAGEPDFFKKACGAVEIAGSTPGPYPGRVRRNHAPDRR